MAWFIDKSYGAWALHSVYIQFYKKTAESAMSTFLYGLLTRDLNDPTVAGKSNIVII